MPLLIKKALFFVVVFFTFFLFTFSRFFPSLVFHTVSFFDVSIEAVVCINSRQQDLGKNVMFGSFMIFFLGLLYSTLFQIPSRHIGRKMH